MSSNAPIGVFDSGVGGLSVLAEIARRLPEESLLYVADSGFVPYGEKTAEFILQRARAISAHLLKQGAKALVVACNTATAAAVAELREQYPNVPIVGMEPAVKPAAAVTRTGVVGVLATTGTLRSAKFAALLDRFASNVRVVTQPCPGLVEQIEAGDLTGPKTRELLSGFVQPLLDQGADTIILGCTHYPFVKPLLQELLPAGTNVVDTGMAVAKRLEQLLAQHDLLATGPAQSPQFWTSGSVVELERVLPELLQLDVRVEALL